MTDPKPNTDNNPDSPVELSTAQWTAALAHIAEAGYQLHESVDDVEPGYEYAYQQLGAELSSIGLVDPDIVRRALNLAQDRYYGSPTPQSDQTLSEFTTQSTDDDND